MYRGSNVVKCLRDLLEGALAGAADGSGELPWVLADEGRAEVEPWPDYDAWRDQPRERVWEIRIHARRMPVVIGRGG